MRIDCPLQLTVSGVPDKDLWLPPTSRCDHLTISRHCNLINRMLMPVSETVILAGENGPHLQGPVVMATTEHTRANRVVTVYRSLPVTRSQNLIALSETSEITWLPDPAETIVLPSVVSPSELTAPWCA